MNVVVFGETGSGKSSLVNLLLGREAAAVSDAALGCTFDFEKYSTESLNLFDTVGLSEGTHGTTKQSFAVEKLTHLLKSLEGGVSLLIFVMKKGRITKSLEENYALFVDAICMKKVPVVLAITNCEMDTVPGLWWDQNKETFNSYGWDVKGAVCCCCLNPEKTNPTMKTAIKSLNESAKIELLDVIQKTKLVHGWVAPGGWRMWLNEILPVAFSIVTGVIHAMFPNYEPSRAIFISGLRMLLINRGYDAATASSIASDIAVAIGSLKGHENC